ncbi:40027_t:CDS:2, partial [Gigaspora margarita]
MLAAYKKLFSKRILYFQKSTKQLFLLKKEVIQLPEKLYLKGTSIIDINDLEDFINEVKEKYSIVALLLKEYSDLNFINKPDLPKNHKE